MLLSKLKMYFMPFYQQAVCSDPCTDHRVSPTQTIPFLPFRIQAPRLPNNDQHN